MAFAILTPSAEKEYAGRHKDFEADLKKFARTRLPGFACPEWVRVVDELPVSPLFTVVPWVSTHHQI